MSDIVIAGMKPYDGRYPFDINDSNLTAREWGWIRRLTGYYPMTWDEGIGGYDQELFACLAVITLRRHGTIDKNEVPGLYERLIDHPFGTIVTLELDEQEADADGPPAESSSRSEPSSGDESPASSETSPENQNGSGMPDSAISGSPSTPWVS
jgi:hypothetical protein